MIRTQYQLKARQQKSEVMDVCHAEHEGFWWGHVQRDGHDTRKHCQQQTPSQVRQTELPEPEKLLVVAVFGRNLGLFYRFVLLVLVLLKLAFLFFSH